METWAVIGDIWNAFDKFGSIGLLICAVIYFKGRLGEVNEKLDECETDRETLHVQAAELATKLDLLEKKMTENCDFPLPEAT